MVATVLNNTRVSNGLLVDRVIRSDLPDFTDKILEEIRLDDIRCFKKELKGWWVPKSYTHTIFERAYLKFVNGNLNYVDLKNMLIHALDPEPYWNAAFPLTKQFCYLTKQTLGEDGPLGRMCLWRLPAGMYIEPHVDSYVYHSCIRRWIYFLTYSELNSVVFGSGTNSINLPTAKGTLIELQPALEQHSFRNLSKEDWYFLAFDTWNTEWLNSLSANQDLKGWSKHPKRQIYLSSH